jgi:hypothetical protein
MRLRPYATRSFRRSPFWFGVSLLSGRTGDGQVGWAMLAWVMIGLWLLRAIT